MKTNKQNIIIGSVLRACSPADSLVSFDEMDNFYEDFLLRKWPRLLDWNFPFELQRGFRKIEMIEHRNEI